VDRETQFPAEVCGVIDGRVQAECAEDAVNVTVNEISGFMNETTANEDLRRVAADVYPQVGGGKESSNPFAD